MRTYTHTHTRRRTTTYIFKEKKNLWEHKVEKSQKEESRYYLEIFITFIPCKDLLYWNYVYQFFKKNFINTKPCNFNQLINSLKWLTA